MGRLPPLLDEHFRHPRHSGPLPGATARGEGENQACGDKLVLQLRVEERRLKEVRFQARACSAVIALASLAAERLQGLDLDAARALELERMVEAAGGLPRERRHALRVVARALAQALSAHPAES
jgi:nitrogen fixation NifU-like protein